MPRTGDMAIIKYHSNAHLWYNYFMNVYRKYSSGPGNDLTRTWALRAFSAVVNGWDGRMTFKMVTDEQMREILDDDDYAIWIAKKREHAAANA